MKGAWTEKEMETLKEAYPVKEPKIDDRLLHRAEAPMSTSRKAKLNGKLEYDTNDDTKYIKAFLPDVYQIPSFELYLEIEINKIDNSTFPAQITEHCLNKYWLGCHPVVNFTFQYFCDIG